MNAVTPDTETVIIGAGVIGLAIAAECARSGQEVFVLERQGAIGQETSSRSSEVIHAGIYYPKGSLKATLCVEGRKRLYQFATENGVKTKRLGKLIVATSEKELETLAAIAAKAKENGVDDLRSLSPADVRNLEPEIACTGALFSPSTGIVDSHGLMLALEGHLTSKGGRVICNTAVSSVALLDSGLFCIRTRSGGDEADLTARNLIVAAGLGMADLAPLLPHAKNYRPPQTFFAKGHYFTTTARTSFSHLIYPVPVAGGLGTHLTLDMAGGARFGPDVQWIERIDYAFDDPAGKRRTAFEHAIRRYWPGLPDNALVSGYTGIRPKISAEGEPAADFAIHGPKTHGVPRMVTLYGIESPGLTSSLAIASYVARLLI
jgi:L-2-hydroxyglutarate oxidase LhgO